MIRSWTVTRGDIPVWLRVTIILFAALAFFDDLLSLMAGDRTSSQLVLMVLQITLSYAAVACLAWSPLLGAVILPAPLALSLMTQVVVSPLICGVVITVAVVCLLPRRVVLLHAAVLCIWVITATLLAGSTDFAWMLAVPLTASSLAGIAVRFFVSQQQQAAARLRHIEAAHQQLREQERLALARDLHDVVAHELTLITMQAAGSYRHDDAGVLHRTISTMEDSARSGVQELRKLLQVLRESPGAGERDHGSSGLATGSIEALLASLSSSMETAGYRVNVRTSDGVDDLPPTLRGTTARILQEATTNIMKYAPPDSQCCFDVTVLQEALVMRIENSLATARRSSQNVQPSLTSGFGLRGIRERVALLDGQVDYGPRHGVWVLDVRIPFS